MVWNEVGLHTYPKAFVIQNLLSWSLKCMYEVILPQLNVRSRDGLRNRKKRGFIVVWPQGAQIFDSVVENPLNYITTSWNSGSVKSMNSNLQNVPLERKGCCYPSLGRNVDDIGFLRKMVDDVTAEYGINKHKHVYWSGLSNGCAMAQMMAAPDIVAAVACTSHYLMKYLTNV